LTAGVHHMELLKIHKSSCVPEGWAKQPANPQTLNRKKQIRGEEVRLDLEGLQTAYTTKPE